MPIRSTWDGPEHSVIITTHSGQLTWQELDDHDENVILPMLEDIDTPIAMIKNIAMSYWLAPNEFIPWVKKTAQLYQAHDVKAILFVTRDQLVGALLENAFQQYGLTDCHYEHTPSLDAAQARLAQI